MLGVSNTVDKTDRQNSDVCVNSELLHEIRTNIAEIKKQDLTQHWTCSFTSQNQEGGAQEGCAHSSEIS